MKSQIMAAIAAASATQPIFRSTHAYGPGVRSYPKRVDWDFVPASINRHTGRPHEHKREIARRTGR